LAQRARCSLHIANICADAILFVLTPSPRVLC
jgi:hypothetical protein